MRNLMLLLLNLPVLLAATAIGGFLSFAVGALCLIEEHLNGKMREAFWQWPWAKWWASHAQFIKRRGAR